MFIILRDDEAQTRIADEDKAYAEAQKRAAANPGHRYDVFVLDSSAQCEATPVKLRKHARDLSDEIKRLSPKDVQKIFREVFGGDLGNGNA